MTAQVRFIDSPIAFGRRPEWVTYTDKTADLSDVWNEHHDPENTIGAYVTGYFRAVDVPTMDERHECGTGTAYELEGISVETGATTYHDRASVLAAWGADTVARVEGVQE